MSRKDDDRFRATPAVAVVVEWTKTTAARAMTLLDRLVAVHLAERIYRHEGQAGPSVRTLAGWLGMSERSVELSLTRITCDSAEPKPVPFIRFKGGSPKGGVRFGSTYRLNVEYLRTLYQLEGPAKPVTPVEVSGPAKPVTPVRIDDRRNPVQRPAKSGAATSETSFAGRTNRESLRREQQNGRPTSFSQMTHHDNGAPSPTTAPTETHNGNGAPTETAPTTERTETERTEPTEAERRQQAAALAAFLRTVVSK